MKREFVSNRGERITLFMFAAAEVVFGLLWGIFRRNWYPMPCLALVATFFVWLAFTRK